MTQATTKRVKASTGAPPVHSVSELLDDNDWEVALLGAAVGRYRITRILGRGGIGTVYLGEHPEIGARVAIKVLHPHVAVLPGMRKRFLREARATNIVDNPHVLKVLDFGRIDDGRDYAVMEYLRGMPLDKLLAQPERVPLERALRLTMQAAQGIAAAHACDITHRDVKPANLFLTTVGGADHLYVLDFGIARLMESHNSSSCTATGMLVGTPAYCAPEQAKQSVVGPPADVYALGTVAYELLTGKPLFSAPTVFELLAQKLNRKNVLDALDPGLPPALRPLLESMLAPAPEQRPTMRQVYEKLAEVAQGGANVGSSEGQPTVVCAVPQDAVLTAGPRSAAGRVPVTQSAPEEATLLKAPENLSGTPPPSSRSLGTEKEEDEILPSTPCGPSHAPFSGPLSTESPVALTQPPISPGCLRPTRGARYKAVMLIALVGTVTTGAIAVGVNHFGQQAPGTEPGPPGVALVQSLTPRTHTSTPTVAKEEMVVDSEGLPIIDVRDETFHSSERPPRHRPQVARPVPSMPTSAPNVRGATAPERSSAPVVTPAAQRPQSPGSYNDWGF